MRMKNNLILFDILIKEHTEVEFLGYHKSSQSEKSLSDVTFDDLPKAEGLIRTFFTLITYKNSIKNGISFILFFTKNF